MSFVNMHACTFSIYKDISGIFFTNLIQNFDFLMMK